jgi:hypothetical protein
MRRQLLARTEFAPVSQPSINGRTDHANRVGCEQIQRNAASTAFVAATAFSAALPSQTGNAGKFVTTDGTNASWAAMSNSSRCNNLSHNRISEHFKWQQIQHRFFH